MPSVRFVLLKGIDDRGVEFFTNYQSRKGRELAANPHAALAIVWRLVARGQLRVDLSAPIARDTRIAAAA